MRSPICRSWARPEEIEGLSFFASAGVATKTSPTSLGSRDGSYPEFDRTPGIAS